MGTGMPNNVHIKTLKWARVFRTFTKTNPSVILPLILFTRKSIHHQMTRRNITSIKILKNK